MLSIEQCRTLLRPECQLSDDDLEQLRDRLYALADVVTTAFVEQRACDNGRPLSKRGVADVFPIEKRGKTAANKETHHHEEIV